MPQELVQYISNTDTKSGYGTFHEGICHQLMNIPTYIHMTSPIRRLVDMLNMIQFQINQGMIEPSSNCLQFYQSWIDKIEIINERSQGIKRLEYETKLLTLYHKEKAIREKVFEGYIIKEINDNIYKIYLSDLKMSSILKTTEKLNMYQQIKCKLYLIKDDINIVQKIRLILVPDS